ncbi:MAG: hypothetical protein JRJ02_05775 [Deltaproteobacteria bacterium]|nr:hypothetical protein [Deltaproteobacteria bacterium]MBW1861866.1 hypothetical protein [Deltaproteobacteria bacterium]
MKKLGIILYFALAYIIFFSSCSPRIRFDTGLQGPQIKRIFLQKLEDIRPINEKEGYKIFYVDSISDKDYDHGFLAEFRRGLIKKLDESFILVLDKEKADIVMDISVRHFYGEYSQSVKTVFWEYGTVILLFLPRLITDAIPYNRFAGRVAMDLSFTGKDGKKISRSLDIKITGNVCTYKRGSAGTASRLSEAASPELNAILREILDEI